MSELVRSLVPLHLTGKQIASRWIFGGQLTGARVADRQEGDMWLGYVLVL